MAQNNPFDFSIFSDTRPTYVGPPVEDVSAARQHLTKTGRENQESKILMESAFSDTLNSLSEDPEGVAKVRQHMDDFESSTKDMIARGDYAYLGPTIRDKAAKFAGDSEIKIRQTRLAEYQGKREAAATNENIDEDDKQVLLQQPYVFNGNMELGTSSPSKFFTPFERVDVNKELLNSFKHLIPEGEAIANVAYEDSTGALSNLKGAGKAVAVLTNGTRLYLDEPRIKQLMISSINNNPALRNYLYQKIAVSSNYDDPSKAIEMIEDAVQNPEKYQDVINSAVTDMASALAYNNVSAAKSIRGIDLTPDTETTEGGGFQSEDIRLREAAGTTPTTITKEGEITDRTRNVTTNIASSLGIDTSKPLSKDDKIRVTEFKDIVQSDDMDALYKYGDNNDISSENIEKMATSAREAIRKNELGVRKQHVIHESIMSGGKYPELSNFTTGSTAEDFNDDTQFFRDKGYDWTTYSGVTPYHQVLSMLNDYKHNNTKHVSSTTRTPFAAGAYTSTTTSYTHEGGRKAIRDINKTLNDARKAYNKYLGEYKDKLGILNKARDGVTVSHVPVYNVKSNKNIINDVSDTFSRSNFIADASTIYDKDMNLLTDAGRSKARSDMLSFIDNADVVDVRISSKPLPGSPSTWRVTYKAKPTANDSGKHEEIYIPIGIAAGGIETQYFGDVIEQNSNYIAQQYTNDVIFANIPGDFNYSEFPDFTYERDDNGALAYNAPDGKSYSLPAFNAKLAQAIQDKKIKRDIDFTRAELSDVIGLENIEAMGALTERTNDPDELKGLVVEFVNEKGINATDAQINALVFMLSYK